MTEDSTQIEAPFLYTQDEVARILRRSASSVKRLRMQGKLAFIPGRPVMIARSDLEAYIRTSTVTVSQPEQPRSFQEMTPAEQVASARQWVLQRKMKFPRTRRSQS